MARQRIGIIEHGPWNTWVLTDNLNRTIKDIERIYMTTLKEIKSNKDDPSLSDAQKFVGGYVECVHLDTGTLIVDEEGKLKNKDVNQVASKMYADKYGDADIIVGDAIYIPNGIKSDWHR
jgi:hypothetical protein